MIANVIVFAMERAESSIIGINLLGMWFRFGPHFGV